MEIGGGLQVAGGFLEMGAATALTAISEGVLAPIGYTIGLHAADNIATGAVKSYSGIDRSTMTAQGLRLLHVNGNTIGALETLPTLTSGLALRTTKYGVTLASKIATQSSKVKNFFQANKETIKSVTVNGSNFMVNGVMGAGSAMYGAMAAEGNKKSIAIWGATGFVAGAFFHRASGSLMGGALLSGTENFVAQAIEINFNNQGKFNITSFMSSFVIGAQLSSITKNMGKVSSFVVSAQYDAAASYLAWKMGEKEKF